MQPLYVSNRVAAEAFYGIYGVWIAGELAVIIRSLLSRGGRNRDRGSLLVVLGSIFAAALVANVLAVLVRGANIPDGPLRVTVFVIGLVAMVAGGLLRFTAVIVLGSSFTYQVKVADNQRVVDRGPYRWVRHPSYSGALLSITGVLLCATNWAALAGVLVALAGVLYRIRVEERALAGELGVAYTSYMRRTTRRLVPFVY
jgi:protein-S-isoprenylcysteine O-methyltransferase Ste14